jgi:hypothetical protein
MKLLALSIPLTLVLMLTAIAPALATVATGQPSNGYYWLLADNGRWQCRSVANNKIQPHQKCIEAGAIKPNA